MCSFCLTFLILLVTSRIPLSQEELDRQFHGTMRCHEASKQLEAEKPNELFNSVAIFALALYNFFKNKEELREGGAYFT